MIRRIGAAFILSLSIAVTFEAAANERPPSVYPQQVTVRLREYRFEPDQITLKAGQETELILVNEGSVLHEFITEALQNLTVNVEVNGVVAETLGLAELEIPPKEKVVLRFTAEKSGEFPFFCRAIAPKDHYIEGMIGKLVIR